MEWTYKGQTYRLVKASGGYDIYRVGGGWIGWSAGAVKDAKDTVKSMITA